MTLRLIPQLSVHLLVSPRPRQVGHLLLKIGVALGLVASGVVATLLLLERKHGPHCHCHRCGIATAARTADTVAPPGSAAAAA